MGEDGSMEWKSQAGFLYAYDMCLMTSSEEEMKTIKEQVDNCVIEYGQKVNEKKPKVVCINGEIERSRRKNRGCYIREVEECKYLGVTVEAV